MNIWLPGLEVSDVTTEQRNASIKQVLIGGEHKALVEPFSRATCISRSDGGSTRWVIQQHRDGSGQTTRVSIDQERMIFFRKHIPNVAHGGGGQGETGRHRLQNG